MAASYTVKDYTFVAEKPRVWIAKLGAAAGNGMWDLAPDGKRVLVVMPVESAEALEWEHEIGDAPELLRLRAAHGTGREIASHADNCGTPL